MRTKNRDRWLTQRVREHPQLPLSELAPIMVVAAERP
jgi:hypothetical protein